MAKQMIMVLDTETCDLNGHVYDVGLTITDRQGNIVHEYNALVREVFTNAERMMGAFYARKIFTHYAPMLNDGTIKMESWETVSNTIRNLAIDYKIDTVAAYNLGFDERVLRNMGEQYNTAPLFSSDIRELDIWRFACEVRLNKKSYIRLAQNSGWVSAKGNIKTGAEFAYRFISGNHDFIEDHTALSDAIIETEILAECFKHKRKVPYNVITPNPWRIVQKAA
jgi:hypothetical protein